MSNRQTGTKPNRIFRAVKDAVTTREAAEHYGISVSRNGMAICPFHEDHNPSLKLDRRFHCFGCQADGDVIDFTALLFETNALDAARKLAADFRYRVNTPTARSAGSDTTRDFKGYACLHSEPSTLKHLNRWRIEYAPKSEGVPWHPLFAEAVRRRDHIAYLLDEFQYGNKETRAALARAYQEEVDNIEQRLSEYDAKAG